MLHLGWMLGKMATLATMRASTKPKEMCWAPLACFQEKNKDAKVAVILLNRPVDDVFPLLRVGWSRAVVRALADGGANRLVACLSEEERKSFIPDVVTGDFDSIEPEVMQYMEDQGSEVIETPDQDHTDFTKCLQIVADRIQEKSLQVDSIMVFGAFGGRFDQTMANIQTLFLAPSYTDIPVFLLGDKSLAILLQPGSHRIAVDTGLEAEWCGLVPISQECQSVTTTGLKWNIENASMQFGGLISTSNKVAAGAKEVTVSTDQPLLWTMGILPETSDR